MALISLNYRDGRPIHEQIRDGMVRLISTGVIGPDEKLPSVRELATQLTINPNTIQKAYAWLESEGYIYTVAGKGSFATPGSGAIEKRRSQLMDKLDLLLLDMADIAVPKSEIIERVKNNYKDRKGGDVS